jgi:hypothetical protein
MADAVTRPTDVSVAAFLAAVEPEDKRRDALALADLFHRVTGYEARMWGPSMVGYGRYDYTYATGRTGTSMATGFSPRKAEHSIYILPGYTDFGDILARLGKHRIGKACLYVKRLSDVDLAVLEELIRAGLADLGTRWPVHPA